MRFEAPWAFLVLLAVPVVLYLQHRLGRRATLTFSTTAHASRSGKSLRQRLVALPAALRIIALVLLAVALARPQRGIEQIRNVSKGIAIAMVVDRSTSMGAEMEFGGERLNRLDVVKKVFQEFVTGNRKGLPGRSNDLVGMIAFARYADTICPLTLAHGALERFLETVHLVQRRSEDGTAIGDAIALAAARLKTAEETLSRQTKGGGDYEIKSKVIILLTDGQNNFGKRPPLDAAKLAREWGIKIYCIGVGSGEAVQTVRTPFGTYKFGAGSQLDARTLRSIADATDGLFRTANDADSLRAVYKEIDELEKSEIESISFRDYRELFTPLAVAALAVLVIEVFLSSTAFRRVP